MIINPGTERNASATLENAETVALIIIDDLELELGACERAPQRDHDGWFGFTFANRNGVTVDVDIPGDDPDQVISGKPLVSRRLYVNGSSWFYGFALNRIEEAA